MEKICNEKTKSNGTDGYFRTILPCRILLKKTILSVVRMTVQERYQVNVLKEKEV